MVVGKRIFLKLQVIFKSSQAIILLKSDLSFKVLCLLLF